MVTGAGVVYYLSDSRKDSKTEAADEKRKPSKKERRKAKKEKGQIDSENVTSPLAKEAPGKYLHPIYSDDGLIYCSS